MVIFHPVSFVTIIIERSIGFGATMDCKLMAIPNPVKKIENNRQIACSSHMVGTIISPIKNNQESIPMPVISAVIVEKNSGRFLCASPLIKINAELTIISQHSIVNPNVRNNPTSKESIGDVPREDCMASAIPNVKITIPII